ncbi:ferredoxin [Hydrogenobacter hydrogenophilus]|uniref:Ferredoxin n=1 Tax=Hydrogenobacter hydrogenophilus TaxID=35835 RepID=A0A285NR58_9AQUI|nr:ferredoxin [Hydrogenobacter hydrogenophilus]SNZ11965.1 ferredoxin [Hydrogenobacter hydrogenophilus]
MRILIDIDTCTACRLCYDMLPQVFADRGDGIPIVWLRVKIDDPLKSSLREVAESCPSSSIQLEEVG